MRGKTKALALVLGAVLAALCTNACKKSAETERTEADKTELRSAEQVTEARKEAAGEKNDYLAAVRREQLELRGRLQEEIDDLDKKLMDLKVDTKKKDGSLWIDSRSKDAPKIRAFLQRRQQLESDLVQVERSDERGWDFLKATVERDLNAKPRDRI